MELHYLDITDAEVDAVREYMAQHPGATLIRIQRLLKCGYTKASKIVTQIEEVKSWRK